MSRFQDARIDAQGRFSLGYDRESGSFYLSIPVANRSADYEEHYALSEAEYTSLISDRDLALSFAEQCGLRRRDELLILKPGGDRGVAT